MRGKLLWEWKASKLYWQHVTCSGGTYRQVPESAVFGADLFAVYCLSRSPWVSKWVVDTPSNSS